MAAFDISRETAGVVLPPSVNAAVWDRVVDEESIVMRLGTRIDVAAGGSITQTITSMPEPEFVGETGVKPVKTVGLGSATMKPYKTALILPFSNEFRRDLPGLFNAITRKLPATISKFVDRRVLYGPSPGTGFSTLAGAPTAALPAGSDYDDYLAVLRTLAANGGDLEAWLLSTQGEVGALGVVDGNGRPMFGGALETGSIGTLLGRPVYRNKQVYNNGATGADTVGFAGDFSEIEYGFVDAINVRYSDQASIDLPDGTTLNLWQRNMFALMVEAELGVAIREPNHFVRLTGDTTA